MTDQLDQIATALAAAQASMPNAAFNRVNPHFKSRYADLAAIRDASLPHLTKNGLAIVQFTSVSAENGTIHLHTKLIHKSGQSIEGAWPIPHGTPQQMGSALTYAKRYGWASIIGMTADDDDDANAAETIKPARNGVSEVTLGQETLPKSKSRPVYDALIKEMRAITVKSDLSKWGLENSSRIYSMHGDFQKWFRDEYKNHITAIEEGVTEDGEVIESPVKKQLKASLEAENVGQ